MNYTELMEVDLGKLGTAVADWKRMAGEMQRLGGEARDGVKAKAEKARWEGINAGVTRDFVGKTVKEFEDLHTEAQSIFSVLDDAHAELQGIQQQARSVTAEAKEKGFSVTGRADGSVVIADALICEVEGPGQRKRDMMRWYADTLTGFVSHATEVDAAAVRALRASHGGDPANPGHASYTSLDEDMLPRALKLAGLGADASDKQRAELRRLWQSLSPESRAQLWVQRREQLLAGGLLTPSVKRVAADDGAGPYDVATPGLGDYWKELQANGISNSGDFIGKTDAARHMDHYLHGTGRTLDLDVDRMLSDEDDTVLRDVSAATRAKLEGEWRRQALDAFAQSGGKPVAIPVETAGEGYTHDKGPDGTANWYLAVGSAMTNTTGVVTAVPGPDGSPRVSIDYQVNVWDRYNWDPGKATPIGPTTVTDADMARLHTTGQAREFDMRGSSSVQQHDVGPGGSWPDPKSPGRDGTRTDIGRNGDAR
ncbi:hypothetical protein OHS33_16000 [Streptomyces sp. NBC_00536]|uniref:hypothetical protein n=1 Tax=Streptomyces sp. NBC_00536 TaxID=2975769 RepID=UPI002E818D6B|nr:hypothetical protein [Streptomyces sp. NBC_00536]WUC79699.1 hypothetical protein OHS33_16000 [Streptomyces sp. NBC_00536]